MAAITIAIRPETVEELKERVLRFWKEMLDRCDQDDGATEVYQLNLQFFPHTRTPKD